MNDWLGLSVRVFALAIAVGLLPLPVTAGQGDPGRSTSAEPTTWAPSRTPWGDPDLQGIWNNTVNTPLERPAALAGQEFLTEEEVAAREARRDAEGSGQTLRLVERFTRVDDTTMTYEFTMDDPETYTTPWTVSVPMTKAGTRPFLSMRVMKAIVVYRTSSAAAVRTIGRGIETWARGRGPRGGKAASTRSARGPTLFWEAIVSNSSICGAFVICMLGAYVSSAIAQTFTPVTEAMLADPDPADWLHMSRTYDQQRHSPLDQINTGNVGQLRMAWSRGLPAGAQESTPLVHDGVMYVIAPGDGVLALDATNGDLMWEQWGEHTPAETARSKSLGIYQDMVYHTAFDGFLRALDARTGEVRWETKIVDDGSRNSAGGVLVADGKVISNRSCNRFDDRVRDTTGRKGCFIAAHDAITGEEVWKFFTTAGADDPGGDTWGTLTSEERVASPWGLPGSYDPSRKVTYWGVANPDPYTRLTRHGAPDGVSNTAPSNLYSNSTVALNVETGELVWYYQELPADDWDADHNQERVLVRTPVTPDPNHVKWISPNAVSDTERDIVVTVAEGGGMFAVNRDDGRFLWARPFPYDTPDLNMNHIDVNTGATQANWDKIFKQDGDTILGCYHNTRSLWNIAYHPGKNSLYVPFHDQCLSMTANVASPYGYGPRFGVMRPGIDPDTYMGIAKIDLSTGEMRVIYSQAQPTNGSALTTAGDLVFFGDLNRRLRALNADDGSVLWETIVGGMIVNSTITYAVDGTQYVMVFTGEGRSATSGPLRVAADFMPEPVRRHNAIYVFALP